MRTVTLAARPAPIDLDLSRTAVLVIDMQNDFGAAGGMFDRAGIDISPIQASIAPTLRVLRAARGAGMHIVYLKMGFRSDLSDAGPTDAPNLLKHAPLNVGQPIKAPDGSVGRILIRETWNTEILEPLRPEPNDVVLYKHRYSGFYETDLDAQLKRLAVQSLLLTGCTTSICVESTLRDAMYRDYTGVVLSDCTAEPLGQDLVRSNHQASLFAIQALFGWVADSQTFIDAVQRY